METRCSSRLRSRRCFPIRSWGAKWASAGSSASRTNSGSTFLRRHSRKSCANNANPEGHGELCAIPGVRRAANQGESTGRGTGTAGTPGDRVDRRLGTRIAAGGGFDGDQDGPVALWVEARRRGRAGDLPAHVVPAAGADLESRGEALLPGSAEG